MREVITYEAFDGEEFENKDECLKYEWEVTHIPPCIKFYDSDMKELLVHDDDDLDNMCEEIDSIYSACTFMLIKDTADKDKQLGMMYNYYGFPDKETRGAGLYKYDWEWNEWRLATIEDFKWGNKV